MTPEGQDTRNAPACHASGAGAGECLSRVSGGRDLPSGQSAFAAGAHGTFSFTGTAVTRIYFRSNVTGIARVFLHGTVVAEDDTYAPATEAPVVIYTASGLSAGPHILTIEVTGTMYPAAAGSWIVVEAFDVSS